ncbi:MAG: M12 family metallo-peptidase [Candidatus Chryseobacterium colombiense]|nr:zinc-dependent metalloprotease family protein [Chryseobacterium sp.]WEK68370.1 MAG: M12 family metallo-peptidase [Chryseobacterium sp.]
MKKIITSLFVGLLAGTATAQWSPSNGASGSAGNPKRGEVVPVATNSMRSYYKLDINQIREQLKNAVEMGANAKPVVISVPTLEGKVQKFNVYSFPVVVKELADQYQLGSYVGAAVDDPTQQIRFSVAPNDFQSMLFKNGNYEFIEPVDKSTGLYAVHPKTKKTGDKPFTCSTTENPNAIQQVENLYDNAKTFTHQPGTFNKSSDKKYRTMRLVMSVTGEYTTYFGGTVAGALTAINATMTRVNGVFEKDFALHLILQSYPGVIYTDATTDPYSPSSSMGNWNTELMNTLHNNVGDANFDIGHLFGASGGGGNAGCIGCVCNNTLSVGGGAFASYKGSGYTSPADGVPQGDNFDIDYVAHEMGHQLGANHTFSHSIEGTGVNVEPGSGSTIMGYAGITGTSTDVQAHSDAYFHKASIGQVQTNLSLSNKTCDTETSVTNNPPTIASLPSYTIPNKTAFVLTASATDPENDPMTYTWEEVDSGSTSAQTINKTNLGTTTYGASFRSFTPTTSPTRYFPKFPSVLAGVLDNSLNTWESTSQVARTSNFAVTVRDNNANATQQQTNFAQQSITVGSDGPFQITSGYVFSNTSTNLTWDVVNTSAAPYNVANVKIDYSTDNGVSWTVLAASTPNNGTATIVALPASLNGQLIVVRISAIGNVFYALKKITVSTQASCGSAPVGLAASSLTSVGGTVSWAPVNGASSYSLQYKLSSASTWTTVPVSSNTYTLSNLTSCSSYQVQVAAVCSGVTGPYSAPITFSTVCTNYCTDTSTNATLDYVSNVTLASVNNTTGASMYSDFTVNSALQPTLLTNSSNSISVSVTTPTATGNTSAMAVWIDFNKNGTFEASEKVLNKPAVLTSVGTVATTGTFTVPSTAITNSPLRMRVVTIVATAASAGASLPESYACGTFTYGEVEDYNVIVQSSLGTRDVENPNNGIQIYPNPATDFLNITKVSDKATYKIYNAAGQLVSNGNISGGKINVSALIKGAYVIAIEDKGNDSFKSKFIKK